MKNIGIKFCLTLLGVALAGAPTFFFMANCLLAPEGFWQKFVALGTTRLCVFGGFQLFLAFALAYFFSLVWSDCSEKQD